MRNTATEKNFMNMRVSHSMGMGALRDVQVPP